MKLLYVGNMQPEYYGIRAEQMQLADLTLAPETGIYIFRAYDLVYAKTYTGADWLNRNEVVDSIGTSVCVFRE